MRAAIIANPFKDEGYRVAARAAAVLLQAGVAVLARPEAASHLPPGVHAVPDEEFFTADFIVTLGGDGTILAAARGAAGRAPLLGVNMGRKGFLTEVELPEMESALRMAARGECRVESRMMLEARVFDESGAERARAVALNDFYITGVTSPRLVHVEARVDDIVAGRYAADGLLVSSPTGSTGYALSAGGPVVAPGMRCLILTPVCAHTLSAVPLVIPAEASVTLAAIGPTREARLNADGEPCATLPQPWRAVVGRAPADALFLRFGKADFYGLLHNKLTEWND